MKKRIICIMGMGLGLAMAVQANFRVWSSQDGASNVEAQFIQMAGSKVVLEKTDGSRVMVPRNMLCAKDQEYLAGVVPPEIKIEVDIDKDSNKVAEGYSYTEKEEKYDFKVTVKKANKDACTQKFTAFLYIIATEAQGARRQVIGSTQQSFSFIDSDSTTLTAKAQVTNSDYYYGGKEGMKYEGYLVVVESEQGEVIKMDSNRSTYESKLDMIRKNKGGAAFSL